MIKDKLTEEQVLALPPAVDLVTAGRAFGLGRTKSYELARAGEFPCPVLPLGHRFMVTKANLLRVLDIKAPAPEPAAPAAAVSPAAA
jgi:hypothetical protein